VSALPIGKIGDLCEQVRGVTYSKGDAVLAPQPGFKPVLRANNITVRGLTFDDLIFVPESKVNARQHIKRNDVVIAASSGSIDVVGKAARAMVDFDGGFGAFCKVLRPSGKIDAGYFSHFFQTKSYRQRISQLAAGANINNLRNEHLNELEIPLPPLSEQRRIAAVLDKADALLAKRREAIAKLDQLLQSVFLDIFGDPVANAKGWHVIELGALISDGPQNGIYKPSSDYGSGTPILRIESFKAGGVIHASPSKRVRLSETDVTKYQLRPNDLVINRVNSPEHLGKPALVGQLSEPTVFESNMMRLSLDQTKVCPAYLLRYLLQDHVRDQISRRRKDAVNQSSINQTDVSTLSVNLPPIELQKRFEAVVNATARQRATFVVGMSKISELFNSLQSGAFSSGR
jgi:type I restriction enzyme S subunit